MNRRPLPYTPLFCEENIWHLARALLDDGHPADRLWVLILSNPARQVALFRQRADDGDGFVVWDYHVVLLARDAEGERIYDFDTTLPFPVERRRYFAETFPATEEIPPPLRARVRRIPAAAYLHRLHSDRSHMVGAIPEEAFPPWPAITPDHAEAITLREYWAMERELADGSRVEALDAYFG